MAKHNRLDFSIVMATYTGIDTLESSLKSILNQRTKKEYEVIIVIDGPNTKLRQIIDEFRKRFVDRKISFRIEQFSKNKGRFEARRRAAELAQAGYILIIDDRVEVPPDYLERISSLNEEAVLPDVRENNPNNFISLTLAEIRRKVYGERWGTNFSPFYIDDKNFEKAPKGTTSIWLNRKDFLRMCARLARSTKITTTSSDDTKLLKYLVQSGIKIYKTSEIKITYNARSTAREEAVHIFHRGPKFIDYYLQPKSRFFWQLMIFYISLAPLTVALIIWPMVAIVIVAAFLTTSAWLAVKISDIPKIFIGLWAIGLFFGAGLLVGLLNKIVPR